MGGIFKRIASWSDHIFHRTRIATVAGNRPVVDVLKRFLFSIDAFTSTYLKRVITVRLPSHIMNITLLYYSFLTFLTLILLQLGHSLVAGSIKIGFPTQPQLSHLYLAIIINYNLTPCSFNISTTTSKGKPHMKLLWLPSIFLTKLVLRWFWGS